MRVIALQGDHLQMGFQHGQQVLDIRPLIVDAIDRRLAVLDGKPISGLLDELRKVWASEACSTLDMLAGMAKALDLDAERLFRYAVASYLEDSLRAATQVDGCTVWAASGPATANRTSILTKNRDYSLGHLALQALALATPQRGYRYLYVTSAGSPGVFSSGMNEQGFAIADTHVPSSDLGPGLPRYILMMDLLEQHASVASALEHLVRIPQMGGGNLVLADAGGEMAVFECGHSFGGVVSSSNHFVVATNHFITASLRGHYLKGFGGQMDDESESRYRAITQRLSECWGNLNSDRARQIMASHGEVAICRHQSFGSSGTISNVLFFPAERSLLYCNGRPCESPYVRYSL